MTCRRSPLFRSFILVIALAATAASRGFALEKFTTESNASDVVVLLDVSQSVLPYFHDITDYVVSSVVKDFLRIGDSFHLLSFGETAQVELAQAVEGEEDVRSILARLYLLYPLARNTDLISAFDYLYQYLVDLSTDRPKVIVVITDGLENPPEGSPSHDLGQEEILKALDAAASRIRSRGWPVYLIRVPFSAERAKAESLGAVQNPAQASPSLTPAASSPAPKASPAATTTKEDEATKALESGANAAMEALASSLGTGITDYEPDGKRETARKSLALPVAEFPANLGRKGLSFDFPIKIANEAEAPVSLELEHVVMDGVDILQKKSFLSLQPGKSGVLEVRVALPPSTTSGDKSIPIELYFADGVRVSPSRGVLSFNLSPNPLSSLFKSGSRIVLFIVLLGAGLILALAAVLLILKRAPRRAAAPVVAAVRRSSQEAEVKTTEKRQAEGEDKRVAPPAAVAPKAPLPESGVASESKAPSARMAQTKATALAETTPAPTVQAKNETTGKASGKASVPLASEQKKGGKVSEKEAAKAEALAEAQAERAARRLATNRPKMLRPGSIQIELRVEGQNPHVGMRNVHTILSGSSKSVGGGRADFLVFLVPAPRYAAEFHFDGERCVFVPIRPECFPELNGNLEDCLDKDIIMVGKRNFRMTLRFRRFIPPTEKINRLLHCIETPGLFLSTGD